MDNVPAIHDNTDGEINEYDIKTKSGGVDTQHTLPHGTPGDVRREVAERIRIFGNGGGFVFATVHNIQHGVSCENLVATYETVGGFRATDVI